MNGEDRLAQKVTEVADIQWDFIMFSETRTRDLDAFLDGHHRHSVAVCLNLKRVPAILIDYLSDDQITVDVWPGSGLESITKEEVIEMCLSDNLYPPKTSKHTISSHMPPIHVLLEVLAESE